MFATRLFTIFTWELFVKGWLLGGKMCSSDVGVASFRSDISRAGTIDRNPKDQINIKPDDQKNDPRTENTKIYIYSVIPFRSYGSASCPLMFLGSNPTNLIWFIIIRSF